MEKLYLCGRRCEQLGFTLAGLTRIPKVLGAVTLAGI